MDRLPTAFFMNRMVAVVERMEKAESKVGFKCEMCLNGKVKDFCRQCTEFMCLQCARQHKRMKAKFPDHKVVTLEELRTGGVKSFPAEQAPPRICQVHNEQRKVYCYDCKELICRDCTLVDHAGHKYNFVVKGAPQVKTTLRDRLVPLRGCSTGIADAVKCVGDAKTQAIEKGASVDAAIKQYCKELHQIIDRREIKLLEASAAIVQKNVEALSAHEKSLASSATVVQDLVEFVDQTLENATDEELMEISDQALKRVNEENIKQATIYIRPDVHVRLEGMDNIAELVQQSTDVYTQPRAISGPELERPIVNEPACIHVHTVDDTPAEVKASLKSLYDHSVLQFKGEQKELGTYEIAYTPVIRGRHELEITVDGVAVYNKPLLVRIPPTQLSKPVRIIPDLIHPYCMAINSTGEVLVSGYDTVVIHVLDKYGQKVRIIEGLQFDMLTGLTVDAADNIYAAGHSRHCISKISKEGELLKEVGHYGSGPGELSKPLGLVVVDNEVYVCDQANNRVQVLDLEFIRMFGKEGTGDGEFFHTRAIAADQDGLLYISDQRNNCVQVLTKEGNFVRSISGKIGHLRLDNPFGLCVVGRYLYMVQGIRRDTDDSYYKFKTCNTAVTVVDKDSGEFVSMFGEADLGDCGCCLITVDPDGFVFVCDFAGCRLVVF